MTVEEVLPEQTSKEKVATVKRFEYSLLGYQLKKQIDIAKTQYQGLDNAFKFNKKECDKTINEHEKKPILKRYNKSDLLYNGKHIFYKYGDI